MKASCAAMTSFLIKLSEMKVSFGGGQVCVAKFHLYRLHWIRRANVLEVCESPDSIGVPEHVGPDLQSRPFAVGREHSVDSGRPALRIARHSQIKHTEKIARIMGN